MSSRAEVPSSPRIVVCGCINSDVVAYVKALPKAGETVLAYKLATHFGGKAANQAAQAALLFDDPREAVGRCRMNLGLGIQSSQEDFNSDGNLDPPRHRAFPSPSVALIGVVGTDSAGNSFLRHFLSLNIDTRGLISTSDSPTGTALITVAEGGENTIAYVPGANSLLNLKLFENHIVLELLQNAEIVLSENGISSAVATKCFRVAKQANKGSITIFTPAPVEGVEDTICCFTDYFLVNRIEAHHLLSIWGSEGPEHEEISDTPDDTDMHVVGRLHDVIVKRALKHPYGLKAKACVVMTNGDKPCVLYANGVATLIPLAVKIPHKDVVDTTGAGDSFAGAFAYFLSRGHSDANAVSLATYVAAQSVLRPGAAESYAGILDVPQRILK